VLQVFHRDCNTLAILGTGILALPVKLDKAGFMPFLITFSVGLIAQSLVMIYMVELLQKTQAIQKEQEENSPGEVELGDSVIPRVQTTIKPAFLSQGPDLHAMGGLFLNRLFGIVFDACVLLHLYFEITFSC
jgi:hypothetical protein